MYFCSYIKSYRSSSFLSKFQNNLQRLHNNLSMCIMMVIQAGGTDGRTEEWSIRWMLQVFNDGTEVLIYRPHVFAHNGMVVRFKYFHFDHSVIVCIGERERVDGEVGGRLRWCIWRFQTHIGDGGASTTRSYSHCVENGCVTTIIQSHLDLEQKSFLFTHSVYI